MSGVLTKRIIGGFEAYTYDEISWQVVAVEDNVESPTLVTYIGDGAKQAAERLAEALNKAVRDDNR